VKDVKLLQVYIYIYFKAAKKQITRGKSRMLYSTCLSFLMQTILLVSDQYLLMLICSWCKGKHMLFAH